MTGLYVFTATVRKRSRRLCPYHNHLCYGELHEYYDTTYMFFDCGTQINYGDGKWREPPKKKCPNCRKHFRPLDILAHQKEHVRGQRSSQ